MRSLGSHGGLEEGSYAPRMGGRAGQSRKAKQEASTGHRGLGPDWAAGRDRVGSMTMGAAVGGTEVSSRGPWSQRVGRSWGRRWPWEASPGWGLQSGAS